MAAKPIPLSANPFTVKIPYKASKKNPRYRKAVVYGDRHGINADPKAVAVLFKILEDVQPDVVINVGDDVDCYTISDFDRDPTRVSSLQEEIDNTREHLHQVSQVAPQAKKFWLEGNHEDRLRRVIWRMPGQAKELAKLRIFQQNMTWPVLAGLKDIGWSFVPLLNQAQFPILPQIITKHGDKISKWSGSTARAEWERYGKSGLSGHTHRLGKFLHRDYNGSHVWQETGCLCKLEDAQWAPDPDWQQGLVVVTHTADGKRFEIQDVYIQNGKAFYNNVLYGG